MARHAFLLLTAAMLIGTYVLRIFGVSLPIVRVAGGLLVTANGWRLLNDDEQAEQRRRDRSTRGSARWRGGPSIR